MWKGAELKNFKQSIRTRARDRLICGSCDQ